MARVAEDTEKQYREVYRPKHWGSRKTIKRKDLRRKRKAERRRRGKI